MLKVEENQAVSAADNCNILERNPGKLQDLSACGSIQVGFKGFISWTEPVGFLLCVFFFFVLILRYYVLNCRLKLLSC